MYNSVNKKCFFILESAEIEGEINIGSDVVSDEDNHQLKLREVFLSRQLEIINANTIRFVQKPFVSSLYYSELSFFKVYEVCL